MFNLSSKFNSVRHIGRIRRTYSLIYYNLKFTRFDNKVNSSFCAQFWVNYQNQNYLKKIYLQVPRLFPVSVTLVSIVILEKLLKARHPHPSFEWFNKYLIFKTSSFVELYPLQSLISLHLDVNPYLIKSHNSVSDLWSM